MKENLEKSSFLEKKKKKKKERQKPEGREVTEKGENMQGYLLFLHHAVFR